MLSILGRKLRSGSVITDPDVLTSYSRDQAVVADVGCPAAAVVARTVEDVQSTLAFANDHRIPVVVRGAGSGLSGGANAIDGCVVLVMTGMNQITDVSSTGLFARVEAGVINGDLKAEARDLNLSYPPDPASAEFSTIGGNIATNAGGLACVKYGTTREYVMSLDVVLADGSRIETGAATRKNSAGYDLTGLIVGSEGTLGVVVGATVRLIPKPAQPATVVAIFEDLADIADFPAELATLGITPSMLEVMDSATINAVEDRFRMGLNRMAGALVIAQVDSGDTRSIGAQVAGLAGDLGAFETYVAADPAEAEMLLQARKLAYTALEQADGTALLDDVAVPIPRLVDLIRSIQRVSDEQGVRVATFGHLGDGSLHPTIVYDARDPGSVVRAKDAFDAIVEAALASGGVVTGEHGVGSLKVRHLSTQLDTAAAGIHAAIKTSLDPNGILNPGKVVPLEWVTNSWGRSGEAVELSQADEGAEPLRDGPVG